MIHARDQLEKVLTDLARHQGGKIFLVGHSMGSLLVVETLRQMSLDGNHALNGGLSGVTLLSPDIDVQVFKRLLERIKPVPQPFLIFISHRDHVLRLAAQLTGQLAPVEDLARLAAAHHGHRPFGVFGNWRSQPHGGGDLDSV